MSLMRSMDLVPLELIDVVYDIMDASSTVKAFLMDSWQVFMSGLRKMG
jgi:hypothetical protein